jgi:hypothetical protein
MATRNRPQEDAEIKPEPVPDDNFHFLAVSEIIAEANGKGKGKGKRETEEQRREGRRVGVDRFRST